MRQSICRFPRARWLGCWGVSLAVIGLTAAIAPAGQAVRPGAVLDVNPQTGNDATGRSGRGPFRTIASALETAQDAPGTTVRLAPGLYSAESGERFPLRVPDGVTLMGNPGDQGRSVAIRGAGGFSSRSFSQQSVAIVLTGGGAVMGVTVSNPVQRGTGIWVESDGASPVIRNNTLSGNHRDGMFVTGRAAPQILNNWFQDNGGNGLSIARDASGFIRENRFQSTGFGITIGGTASPVVEGNEVVQNRDGVVVSGSAQPMLRRNAIERNANDGLVVIDRAQPDLGTAFSPGENRITNNGRYAIFNATKGGPIPAVGNSLDSSRVMGSVLLSAGAIAPIARWQP